MGDQDLIALWEAHCRFEFETRDVDATMATMVAEPYVNHVPTMTGGVLHRLWKSELGYTGRRSINRAHAHAAVDRRF
jgi:hypothetical protein